VALAGIQKFESSGDDINSTFKISNGFVLAHSFQVYQNAFLQNFFWKKTNFSNSPPPPNLSSECQNFTFCESCSS
jgi:hypothetical protein